MAKSSNRSAGIRMPRAALKGLIIRFLNSPTGRAFLAEAVVLVAGVFGARKLRSRAASRGGQETRVTVEEARARLSYACVQAMKAFRAALAERASVIEHTGAEPVRRRTKPRVSR